MKRTLIIFFSLALIATGMARTMDRCSLAREMSSMGVPREDLAKWACIAEKESTFRTHAVGPPNSDGSRDYGIFQINDRYWCAPSYGPYVGISSNGCGISCDALLGDGIAPAVRCALTVQGAQGWAAWTTWKYCNGYVPPVDHCF